MGKRVTLQMIAERAGVSAVTVSNVLSGKKGAGAEVCSRVLAIADELGYRREKKRDEPCFYRIGVMIAERYVKEYISYYMNLYKLIAHEALQQKCFTVLDVVSEEREKLRERFYAFENTEIQGILIIGEMNPEFVKKLAPVNGLPVVCVDFYNADLELDFIVANSFRGMQEVTEQVIRSGCKELIFLGTPEATSSIMDRYLGFCKAVLMHGLSEKPPLYDREKSRYSNKITFELPEKLPDAFICNCEQTAVTLTRNLRKRGLKIPDDVSVAAFDRFLETDEAGLQFLTYACDEKAMAEISVSTLIRRINGDNCQKGIRMVEGAVVDGNTVKRRRE